MEKCLDYDIIISSGGVSVGDYDLVKDTLVRFGGRIKLWQVAMRPGKPLAFGVVKGRDGKLIPVFGLPGNPVSNEASVILDENIIKKPGLRYFLRANTAWKNGDYHACVAGPQGSGILKSFILANSLIVLPEEKKLLVEEIR